MSYKMIVFDWDGTILNSTGAIAKAIQAACHDVGLPDPGFDTASYVIGLGLNDALAKAAPSATPEQVTQLVQQYRLHYSRQDEALCLFDGVKPLLQALNNKQILCSVATGKSRAGLNRAMHLSQTAQWFQASRCADECHSKPHPQMLLELLQEFDLSPHEALMIGDTTFDLQMAQNAGVPAVAVYSGAHPPSVLAQVPHLKGFASINEASPWLLSLLDSSTPRIQ